MSRITKILGFSVPPSMVEEVEQIAQEERRTKSELFREMLRVYQAYRKHPGGVEPGNNRVRAARREGTSGKGEIPAKL
jgi:metal-responsive CopG/Arc/MetJ family transcriptional regulator